MYQESYDNAGLIVGDPQAEATGVMICLDALEAVVEEAAEKGCNLVVAHHPIVFGGLKRLNGRTYVERTVMAAIRKGVAIYAAHTNLDNVLRSGVNAKIAEKIGLRSTRILVPKKGVLKKLFTYAPVDSAEKIRNGLFEAGAGHIGLYDECSFNTLGAGTFRAREGANPFVGEIGQRHVSAEMKIEVVFAAHQQGALLAALRASHPYEEVAYEIVALDQAHPEIGAGLVGELETPLYMDDFLRQLKTQMNTGCVRYTLPCHETVRRVAVCGGAGSFLLRDAIAAGAEVFVTADFKYHEFFDAEGRIVIADIGHFESEQFTMELFSQLISEKFPTFAVRLTEVNTNPVNYL